MFELMPASSVLIAHYQDNMSYHSQLAEKLSIAKFGIQSRNDLKALLKKDDAINLVESVVRIQNYSDLKDLDEMRKAVSKLLKNDGVSLPRGKRTKVGMLEMMAGVAPILLYIGLPCAFSERSKLVLALRIIAEDLGLEGDPRDELRRLKKVKALHERAARKAVLEAVKKGLQPLLTTPLEYTPPKR